MNESATRQWLIAALLIALMLNCVGLLAPKTNPESKITGSGFITGWSVR